MDTLYEKDSFDLDVLDGISSRDIADFVENRIWNAICLDLKKRLEFTDFLLESAPVDDEWGADEHGRRILLHAGVKRLQGACVEIRYLLELPNAFKDVLIEKEEEIKRD
jgi:hypothetical protein